MNSGLQRGAGTEGFSLLGVQDLKSMYYYIMAWYVAWSIRSGILWSLDITGRSWCKRETKDGYFAVSMANTMLEIKCVREGLRV